MSFVLVHSKEEFKAIIRKPWFTSIMLVALIVNVLNWALLVYKLEPSDLPIFLHYNIYLGIDRIGTWYFLYLMPLSGTVIFLTNLFIAMFLFYRERVMSIMTVLLTLGAEMTLVVSSVLILLKNLSL